MTEDATFSDRADAHRSTPTTEIFDPPMCCPTGLCGPTLDQRLLDLSEMILNLQSEGVQVKRYQMTSHPHAFLNNSDVMQLLRERGTAALPITVVAGRMVKAGAYPTPSEVKAALNGTAT